MNKEQAMTKQPSFLAKATEKLLKNKLAALCFVLLVLEVLLLLITPWIAPHDPEATNAAIKFAPGFWAKFSSDPAVRAAYVPGYLLGTDNPVSYTHLKGFQESPGIN